MSTQKHTSELLEDFKSKLINRKKELYEISEIYDENDDKDSILLEFCRDEINKITTILKTIKKF